MAKYLKQGVEQTYTEDSAEIQYLKFNMARHAVLGFMLGDFDERGEYVIDLEIVKELVAMPKYFVDSMENVDICHSVLVLNSPLTFLVTFEGDTATLSLVEKLSFEGNFKFNAGSYSNINEYVLDRIKTSGTIDKNKVYRRWNINQFGGNSLDIHNLDEEQLQAFYGIVARFKYLLYANTLFAQKEEELELAEATYNKDMLELISRYPELEKAVAEQIKDALDKKSILQLDKPNFAKTLNEVVDFAVEFNLQNLTPEQQKEFLAERHNLQLNKNVKSEQAIPLKTSNVDLDGNETAVGKPVVETFNEQTTLSIFALDEQLKEAQNKTYASAQNRAVDIIRSLNKAKIAGELIGVMAAIVGEIKNKTNQDITENINDLTKQIVAGNTKQETKIDTKGLLGKVVAEEKKAAPSAKTEVKNENKNVKKGVGQNVNKKTRATVNKATTKTDKNAKSPTGIRSTGYAYTAQTNKEEKDSSSTERKGLIAQEVNPNQNQDNVTARPVNLADINAAMNNKQVTNARRTGVKPLLSNTDVKSVNSTVDANINNINIEEEGTTLNR